MPAQLDPSIILNSDHDRVVVAQNEVNQRAKEAAARIAIDSQEADLRRQEIMARRDEIIQRAMERNQSAQPKPLTPKDQMEAYDLRVKQATLVGNLLEGATDDDSYEQAKQGIAQIVGPDYVQHLPQTFDPAVNARLVAQGKALVAKAQAGNLQRIETTDAQGNPIQQFVKPTEGATYPIKPPTPASAQRPVQVETVDDKGRRVTKFVTPTEGMEIPKPAPAAGGMSAGESAKRSDAKTVAQGIKQFADTGEGISPEVLISGRTTEQGMALNAELQKMGVDTSKLTREWLATKGAIRSLDGAGQIRLAQVINKASASLDRLDELNKQWSQNATRWGIKAVNHAALKAAQNGQYGPEAAKVATNLESQIADVTAEIGQGIMGGNSPTDRALILASHNLSTDWTQPVLDSGIKQVRYNLNLAQTARNEMLNQLGVQSTQFQTPAAGSTLPPPPTERVNPFRPKAK